MEQEQLGDKIHRLPVVVNGDHVPPLFLSKLEYGAYALALKKKQPALQEEEDDEEELRRLQVEMAM